ncbi:hypothetical protein ABEB36_000172 [Hypothenemus hampei]|uniref:MADF domain-containing protein n=1 Tax=Hypothenemus hampei TaxID=57062 RepID=A0ABD1FAG6_HYPHA
MEWANDKTIELIELYRSKDCLWNPKSKHYKLLNKKNDAWGEIASEINCDMPEVKKKVNSLLASFRRERQKVVAKKSGSGADEVYHSTWFAFKSLYFLMDKFTPKTENTKEIPKELTDNEGISNDEHAITDTLLQREEQQDITQQPKTAKQNRKRQSIENRLDEAYSLMKETVAKKSNKTSDVIFGQYVASKMEKYSDRSKNIVQHLINNILFEADMGRYDVENVVLPRPPSSSQNPSCLSPISTPLPSPASEVIDTTGYENQEGYLAKNKISTYVTHFFP